MQRLLYLTMIMAACIIAATVPVAMASTLPDLSYTIFVSNAPLNSVGTTTSSFFSGFNGGIFSPSVTFPIDGSAFPMGISPFATSSGTSQGSVSAYANVHSMTAYSELEYSQSVSLSGNIQQFSFSAHYTA